MILKQIKIVPGVALGMICLLIFGGGFSQSGVFNFRQTKDNTPDYVKYLEKRHFWNVQTTNPINKTPAFKLNANLVGLNLSELKNAGQNTMFINNTGYINPNNDLQFENFLSFFYDYGFDTGFVNFYPSQNISDPLAPKPFPKKLFYFIYSPLNIRAFNIKSTEIHIFNSGTNSVIFTASDAKDDYNFKVNVAKTPGRSMPHITVTNNLNQHSALISPIDNKIAKFKFFNKDKITVDCGVEKVFFSSALSDDPFIFNKKSNYEIVHTVGYIDHNMFAFETRVQLSDAKGNPLDHSFKNALFAVNSQTILDSPSAQTMNTGSVYATDDIDAADGLSTGAIIGISVGAVALVSLVAGLGLWYYKKHPRKSKI